MYRRVSPAISYPVSGLSLVGYLSEALEKCQNRTYLFKKITRIFHLAIGWYW